MRRVRTAVLGGVLLAAVPAAAQEATTQEAAPSRTQEAAREAASREAARLRILEATKLRIQEMAKEAREGRRAREDHHKVALDAKRAADNGRIEAARAEASAKADSQMSSAARDMAIGIASAAGALGSDAGKMARQDVGGTRGPPALTPERRAEHLHAARLARWALLRRQIGLGSVPGHITAELLVNARRVAWLNRIRIVAQAAEDAAAIARVEALIAREQARHDARIATLIAANAAVGPPDARPAADAAAVATAGPSPTTAGGTP